MQELDVTAILHLAMLVTLKMAAPVLLAALGSGLLVAVFQAVTQISDSTLAFLPKIISTGAALWFAGPFFYQALADFTRLIFDRIVALGGQ